MALFDLPLDQLRGYRPDPDEPADFDAFWERSLDEAAVHPLDARFTPYDAALAAVDSYDVSFAGWGGHRISAWLNVPAGAGGPLPTVVHYLGYGGGRGLPLDHLVWPAAGWATLVVDTRGQGAVNHHSAGSTPDPHGVANPQSPGFMTNGILDPETYFYRRVFTDAVRAVEAARSHPSVDPARIVVNGASQGGGIAQAVAALSPHVKAAFVDVPFLTHYRRAVEITDKDPYQEIVRFLATQHGAQEQVFRTLSYFDGVSFAARATVPALYSVALMDPICPPSTVFAAYNHWAGPKEIEVYPWNGHEGGAAVHRQAQLRKLRDLA
ncbi:MULTISPECIES: acetylxylan esterase [unclassified Streptomyces]|uniref:acetylxylan esterase n=1 Tax=unclassified Streptomyces TaxID=2593676 RepID=UPI00036913C6|nr:MULTISPECIES: acetylxylan esterase [unclassified Streptomyces]MYY05349.1 prolyl oligopeptidase family serine peptidase [Streptomyces sp. SID4913]